MRNTPALPRHDTNHALRAAYAGLTNEIGLLDLSGGNGALSKLCGSISREALELLWGNTPPEVALQRIQEMRMQIAPIEESAAA